MGAFGYWTFGIFGVVWLVGLIGLRGGLLLYFTSNEIMLFLVWLGVSFVGGGVAGLLLDWCLMGGRSDD